MTSASNIIRDLKIRGLPHQRSLCNILSMNCDQIQLEDGCLDDIQQLPHDTVAVNWKLSGWLPTEQLEREEPADNLVDLGTRLGSAGNGKEPICWRT